MLAAATTAVLFLQANVARADEVPATGKGIVGGALLGGEVVIIGEAIGGVKSGLAYLLGGIAGAGAGAFVGWEAEQNADPRVSVYMLAGGMALLIPATVAALQATAYEPPADYTEDRPSVGAPIPEPPSSAPGPMPSTGPVAPTPGVPSTTTPPPASAPLPPGSPGSTLHMHWHAPRLVLPGGLLAFNEGLLRVAVPAVEIRPTYRIDELQKFGLEQKQEVHFALLSSTF